MTNATSEMSASAYIARRPEWIHASSRARPPYSDAPSPYTAVAKPRISRSRPTDAMRSAAVARRHSEPAPEEPAFGMAPEAALYFEGHFVVSEFATPV